VQLESVAPAIYTANAAGTGVAAAYVQSGSDTQLIFDCTSAGNCAPRPIRVGTGDVYLILFGTGLRNNTDLTKVSVTIGGEHARVLYAGPQNQYPGMDQINVVIPGDLAGQGVVDVVVTVAGKTANTVTMQIQ